MTLDFCAQKDRLRNYSVQIAVPDFPGIASSHSRKFGIGNDREFPGARFPGAREWISYVCEQNFIRLMSENEVSGICAFLNFNF